MRLARPVGDTRNILTVGLSELADFMEEIIETLSDSRSVQIRWNEDIGWPASPFVSWQERHPAFGLDPSTEHIKLRSPCFHSIVLKGRLCRCGNDSSARSS
jgi:hypothetical protein